MQEENDIDRALNDPELDAIKDFNLKFRMYLAKDKLDQNIYRIEYLIKHCEASANLKIELLDLLYRMHGTERDYLFEDPKNYLELYDDMPSITTNPNNNSHPDDDWEPPF